MRGDGPEPAARGGLPGGGSRRGGIPSDCTPPAVDRTALVDALSGPGVDGASCSSCHQDPHALLRTTPREVPPTAREEALAEVSSFGAIGLLAAVSLVDHQAPDLAWGQPPSRGELREAARLYDVTVEAAPEVEGRGFAQDVRAEKSVLSTGATAADLNLVHAVSRPTQPASGHLRRLVAHG